MTITRAEIPTMWEILAIVAVETCEFIAVKCTCNGGDCMEPAQWLVPWPGRDPAPRCQSHYDQTRGIARAMGFELLGALPMPPRYREPPDPSAERFAAMELH
jgi:hypothetical protein